MIIDERDGVNRLLKAIGESTIASLSDKTLNNNYDAESALNTLQQYTSEVQEQGVYTNTEQMVLSPDVNMKIILPENILNICSAGKDSYRNLVERGMVLYDIDNNTDSFGTAIEVSITIELPFKELPQAVKTYIIMNATVAFIISVKGDKARLPYTEKQLQDARTALDKTRVKNTRPNMLQDNFPHIGRFHNRFL